MLASALGGTVWQDLSLKPSQDKTLERVKHSQDLDRTVASHTVQVEKGSLLERIYGTSQAQGEDTAAPQHLYVNSFHHQAVREPGPRLRVSAMAPDGVIEALESSEHKSIVGVQWHPECFILRGDDTHLPLFSWLISEAENYAQARRVHERVLTLDSHCDTAMFFSQGIHFDQRDPKILVDLHKMNEGHLDASIMVAYLPQGERTPEGHAAATAQADSLLTQLEAMVKANEAHVGIARTPADLYRLKQEGRKAIMLGIENGYAIGHDLANLRHFAQRGIVYMTLCHNGNNDICGSARGNDEQLGVSAFGEEVIREMNRLGVMVDLSHGGERSFYEALEISSLPIVCSHSSARALCDHPRNLTDDQMLALARHDGVAQVTFYKGFLRAEGTASIEDAVAHLNHMIRIMGIEHVGIGTDFDGDGGVPGLASASEVINFTRRLLRERYSEADLRLIWGGNFLRVMEQVQQARIQ